MSDEDKRIERASKGGLARAATMTAARRREIAALAAAAKHMPRETHTGEIQVRDIVVPCSVLEGGRRVIPRAGIRTAFDVRGRSRSAGSGEDGIIPAFLASAWVLPHVSAELETMFRRSLVYRSMHQAGGKAYAYPAEILPLICETLIDAGHAGGDRLTAAQQRIVAAAGILHRGLARVGIIALVDEATGYQSAERYAKILEQYIVDELRPWVERFPAEFFRQIHRLQGWRYEEGQTQGPRYVGKLINKYIYDRLPPGVHDKLRTLNPAINGRRRHQHHRHLTDHTGIPHLDRQITAVTTLMAVADDKKTFEALLKKRFPKSGDQMDLPHSVIVDVDS